MAPSSDTKVVGSAGEHFVCSTLAQLRWSAALTREGVAHADVLAVHPDPPRRMVEVQVKTIRANPRPKWPMGGRWTSGASRAASGTCSSCWGRMSLNARAVS